MAWLLNLAYLLLLLVVSPWLAYQSMRTGKYRRGWRQKFLGRVPELRGDGDRVWIHAVSVGEINLLGPILDIIARERPGWECVISTTTDTGFALARKKYPGHTVFYCPLDFSWAVRAALSRMKPSMLVLAELELWPNLIREAHRRGVKIAVINARLSEPSFRGYQRLGRFMRGIVTRIDVIAAQNEEYAERFRGLGVAANRVHVTGSIKFDNAPTDRRNPGTRRLGRLAGISASETVFLAGSTQTPEEAMCLKAYNAMRADFPQLRLIIVPRHPERFDEVARMLNESGAKWLRRSELNANRPAQGHVILVDTVGELGAWWGLAHIAFVGGSMGSRGGQNMIEPAAYGAAVSFGPNTRNFRDIVRMMLAANAATVVGNQDELTRFVRHCLEHPDFAGEQGMRARELVARHQGAAEKTAGVLLKLDGEVAEPDLTIRPAA